MPKSVSEQIGWELSDETVAFDCVFRDCGAYVPLHLRCCCRNACAIRCAVVSRPGDYQRGATRWTKTWRQNHKNTVKDYSLRNRYGISLEEYRAMQSLQNYCCQLCRKKEKLDVDHDHRLGVVRSLLCRRCNLLVGFHEKSPGLFRKIQKYTKEFDQW